MLYRDFMDCKLSALGMGGMRLPTVGSGRDSVPDEAQSRVLIDYLYRQGVNYFDTAYLYHNGASETMLGKLLSAYPRESFYLADKFWHQSLKDGLTIPEVLEIQLGRCQVDYFDFYLIHSVGNENIEDYLELDRTQNMMAYFASERAAGRIRHLGFSCHSNAENMVRFLDFYPFDFVMVQCNYIDWTFQDAKRKYEILTERGIPMLVMEPVRGGALATHGEALDALLKQARPDESVAAWAFRYLQGLENVAVILSGMSTLAQAEDNVKTFSRSLPLNDAEQAVLQRVLDERLTLIPCTGCDYCHDCPQELHIAKLLSIYNESLIHPASIQWNAAGLTEAQQPSQCSACGLCTKVCPQEIAIPDRLKELDALLAKKVDKKKCANNSKECANIS